MRTSISVLATLALVFVSSLSAQPRSQLQNMVDKLNLTPEQKAKADPILDEDAKQVRALRTDTTLSAEERSRKTAEIRSQSDQKLKPILTAEQWKKLEQLREERKQQAKDGKQEKKKK